MSKIERLLLPSLGVFVSMALFQNCSKVGYSSSSSSGSLIAQSTGASEEGQIPVQPTISESVGDGLYVCILEGNGKSTKLAYLDNTLLGKVATPADVCMSRHACLDIVSQVFKVQEAAYRGFCPDKNPHVVTYSDAQLQAMIEKMKMP